MKVYYWYIFLFIATARGGCRSNSPPNPVMPGSPTDGDPKILPLLFPIINTKMEAQGFTSFNITHYLKFTSQVVAGQIHTLIYVLKGIKNDVSESGVYYIKIFSDLHGDMSVSDLYDFNTTQLTNMVDPTEITGISVIIEKYLKSENEYKTEEEPKMQFGKSYIVQQKWGEGKNKIIMANTILQGLNVNCIEGRQFWIEYKEKLHGNVLYSSETALPMSSDWESYNPRICAEQRSYVGCIYGEKCDYAHFYPEMKCKSLALKGTINR